MELRATLEQLCGMAGPSGFEARVADTAVRLMAPLLDETWVDRFGNAVGVRRCGVPGAKKLLLDAHLDEVGLVVTGTEEGFLRVQSIGGVDPRMLPNRELTILTNPPRLGVVAVLPPHVQKADDRNKSTPIDEQYVDVGLSREEAERLIPVGTPVVFRGGAFALGERLMCGKAMDDRAGFAVLLRTARLLRDRALDVDLYLMGSTREEVSGAGARTGTFALAPDCCVALDVTHGKTPDAANPKDRTCELLSGPAIGVGPNMTRWMTGRLVEKARAAELPYQLEVMEGHTGTNAWHMQVVREGIATAVLSLPLKYMHSPIEVVALEDMEHTAQLLAAFAEGLGEEGAFAVC